MSVVSQEKASRECLAPLKYRAARPWHKVQLGNIDPENDALRTVVKTLIHFFTDLLSTTAKSALSLDTIPAERTIPSLILKCVHDCVLDSGSKAAPHLVADCTELCKLLADAAAKKAFGDKGLDSYDVMLAIFRKTAKKAQSWFAKKNKILAKAKKQVKSAAKKSNAKATANADRALDKALKALAEAQTAVDDAANDIMATEAKTAKSVEMQNQLIQCWRGAVNAVKSKTSSFPPCVESCRLFVPGCLKGKGQCACNYCIRDEISTSCVEDDTRLVEG